MGNPAGVKRDFAALEKRRLKAFKLLDEGLPQAEAARRVGVHRQSVSRWARAAKAKGKTALLRAGRPAAGTGSARLCHDAVDHWPRGCAHRATNRLPVSSGPRLAAAAVFRLEF